MMSMDKVGLQYVIVARRYQLPSIYFIAFAIGTHKENGVIAVPIETKNTKATGFVALAIEHKQKLNNSWLQKAWREKTC